MKGLENEIKGTVIVNASDPAVGGTEKYILAKIVDGEVWYHASTNDLNFAKKMVQDNMEFQPLFIIERSVS